jgi:glucan phosphorylase
MVRAKETLMQTERMVGCFSMEIALEAGLPTYRGGLGALAGDTMLNMT